VHLYSSTCRRNPVLPLKQIKNDRREAELVGGVWRVSFWLLLENASTCPWRPGGYSDFWGTLSQSQPLPHAPGHLPGGHALCPEERVLGSALNSCFDPGCSHGDARVQDEDAGSRQGGRLGALARTARGVLLTTEKEGIWGNELEGFPQTFVII